MNSGPRFRSTSTLPPVCVLGGSEQPKRLNVSCHSFLSYHGAPGTPAFYSTFESPKSRLGFRRLHAAILCIPAGSSRGFERKSTKYHFAVTKLNHKFYSEILLTWFLSAFALQATLALVVPALLGTQVSRLGSGSLIRHLCLQSTADNWPKV